MELRGQGYGSGVKRTILTFSDGFYLPRYEVFGVSRSFFIIHISQYMPQSTAEATSFSYVTFLGFPGRFWFLFICGIGFSIVYGLHLSGELPPCYFSGTFRFS